MTLDELRTLEAAATPGPWSLRLLRGDIPQHCRVIDTDGDWIPLRNGGATVLDGVSMLVGDPEDLTATCFPVNDENAALIAAMRNALPDLIAAVEALAWVHAAWVIGDIDPDAMRNARAILKRLGVE